MRYKKAKRDMMADMFVNGAGHDITPIGPSMVHTAAVISKAKIVLLPCECCVPRHMRLNSTMPTAASAAHTNG